MTKIILEPGVARQLHGLGQPVELCDPSGRMHGRFVPVVDLSEWEAVSPDATEEELRKRANSSEKQYSTAEVLAHLEKL